MSQDVRFELNYKNLQESKIINKISNSLLKCCEDTQWDYEIKKNYAWYRNWYLFIDIEIV